MTFSCIFKAYFDEQKKIEDLLEDDITEHEDSFMNPGAFHFSRVSHYPSERSLILDLKERPKGSVSRDDYRKLDNSKRFQNAFHERFIKYPNDNEDVVWLRVVFREIFSNTAKLPNKHRDLTAATIAQKIIGNEDIEERHLIFIKKKIQRGTFREYGVLKEYRLRNMIHQTWRQLILEVFDLPTDTMMIMAIHDCFQEALSSIKKVYQQIFK